MAHFELALSCSEGITIHSAPSLACESFADGPLFFDCGRISTWISCKNGVRTCETLMTGSLWRQLIYPSQNLKEERSFKRLRRSNSGFATSSFFFFRRGLQYRLLSVQSPGPSELHGNLHELAQHQGQEHLRQEIYIRNVNRTQYSFSWRTIQKYNFFLCMYLQTQI